MSDCTHKVLTSASFKLHQEIYSPNIPSAYTAWLTPSTAMCIHFANIQFMIDAWIDHWIRPGVHNNNRNHNLLSYMEFWFIKQYRITRHQDMSINMIIVCCSRQIVCNKLMNFRWTVILMRCNWIVQFHAFTLIDCLVYVQALIWFQSRITY